jgi:hypothetical protein
MSLQSFALLMFEHQQGGARKLLEVTIMQLYSNTGEGSLNTLTEREQIVLSLLHHVTPMIKKFAYEWHLEYDDLYQDATLHLMELLDTGKVDFTRNYEAFASIRIHWRLLDKVRYTQRRKAVSLDAALCIDEEMTLADLLPSLYSTDPATVVLVKERLENLETSVRYMTGTHGVAVRSRYETALATYC